MRPTRERILFFVAVGIMGLGMGYMIYFKALLEPAGRFRQQARIVEQEISDLELKLARGRQTAARMKGWLEASFGLDESQASERLRAHLIALHGRARLNATDLTMTPFTGARVGEARQVGWIIKTRGPLERIVDLLYLLQGDPHLHKLDSINWMPVPRSTDVELSVKYATLVLPVPAGEKPPRFADALPDAPDPLAADSRKPYAIIAQRDVFRPYIRRPPPPPPPAAAPAAPTIDRQTQIKVVGLPTWDGKPTVVVRDVQSQQTHSYHLGDDLAGGEIVMVDYRPVPRPDKPYLNSPSRVIVRIGREHWAVELGHTLAQKRKLTAGQVPVGLQQDLDALTPAGAAPAAPPSPDAPVSGTEKEPQEITHAP